MRAPRVHQQQHDLIANERALTDGAWRLGPGDSMCGEHAALRSGLLFSRHVEQVQGMHDVVAEHFSVVADLNCQQLGGRLASVVAGVAIATFETESVGTPGRRWARQRRLGAVAPPPPEEGGVEGVVVVVGPQELSAVEHVARLPLLPQFWPTPRRA